MDMIRLTGLWKSKTKSGAPMLSGTLTPGARLIILPNERKQKDSDPDCYLFVTAPKPREERAREGAPDADAF